MNQMIMDAIKRGLESLTGWRARRRGMGAVAIRALILAALLAGCASYADREERAERALRMAEWARGGGHTAWAIEYEHEYRMLAR